MRKTNGTRYICFALAALILGAGGAAYTQVITPTNALPNPYRSIENWAKLPDGRNWGSTSAVDIDPDGTSVLAAAPTSSMRHRLSS